MENRIKDLREQRNMTQMDLAQILNVSRQTIISLENGKYNPSLPLAFQISKVFKLTIEEIFIYEEE